MDGTKRKGQVAIEFLMYAGLFMIIAIGAYLLTSFTERGEVSLRESQFINAFGYKFASAPTVAYKGGEGLSYDIAFPKKLEDRPYNVTYICRGISTEEGNCHVQIGWNGTYQEFNYPYVIAPANYQKGTDAGTSNCLQEYSKRGYHVISLDSEASGGHLIFRNIGMQGTDKYPTIEMYCEVN